MGEVVNLNRFRKQAERRDAEAKAAENRTRFGRTGAEKAKDRAEREQADRLLDGARIEGDARPPGDDRG